MKRWMLLIGIVVVVFVGVALLLHGWRSSGDVVRAASLGDAWRVHALLALGADPDRTFASGQGWTGLHYAVHGNNQEIVEDLLDHGADTEVVTDDDWTPLLLACANGAPPDMVRALLDAGADPDRRKPPALLPAPGTPISPIPGDGTLNEAERQALVEFVGELMEGCEYGLTPLHLAAGRGHTGIVALLAEAGADLEAVDMDGYTPLHYTANGGHAEAVRALLAAGADPEHRAGDGSIALDLAQAKGHNEVADALRRE